MKIVKNCPCCNSESNWEYIGTNTIRILCSKCGIHTISGGDTLEYKEVKEMRSGKIKKTAWDDFIDEMKYFCGEEGNKNRT